MWVWVCVEIICQPKKWVYVEIICHLKKNQKKKVDEVESELSVFVKKNSKKRMHVEIICHLKKNRRQRALRTMTTMQKLKIKN